MFPDLDIWKQMLNSKNCWAKPTGKNNPTCYYEVSKWTVDVHDEMYFHEDSKNQVSSI